MAPYSLVFICDYLCPPPHLIPSIRVSRETKEEGGLTRPGESLREGEEEFPLGVVLPVFSGLLGTTDTPCPVPVPAPLA